MRPYYSILIFLLGALYLFVATFLMKKRSIRAKAVFFLGGILLVLVGIVLILGLGSFSNGQN
jgi:hypothetical protein